MIYLNLKLPNFNSNETATVPLLLFQLFFKTKQNKQQGNQSKSSNFYIHRHRLQRSNMYIGVKVWNSIPENIKKTPRKSI